jgi:hypothetical protein
MLTPDKHTNIKYSILYISGLIMSEINRSGIIQYDDLKNVIINKLGNNLGDNFEYALSFLFSIDKINYNKELDSLLNTEI